MTATAINKQRLLKLADLRYGKLGHSSFDFRYLNLDGNEKNHCGSRGCALGEMPIVDPEEWTWKQSGRLIPSWVPALRQYEEFNVPPSVFAKIYFQISLRQSEILFFPNQITDLEKQKYGIDYLDVYATKIDVALNIERFVLATCGWDESDFSYLKKEDRAR